MTESSPNPFFNWGAVRRVIDALNDSDEPNIPGTYPGIVLAIARRIDLNSGIALATWEDIMREARVSHTTLSLALNRLVAMGLFVRISGGRPNRANRYKIGAAVPELVEMRRSETSQKPSGGRKPPASAPQASEKDASFDKLLNYA